MSQQVTRKLSLEEIAKLNSVREESGQGGPPVQVIPPGVSGKKQAKSEEDNEARKRAKYDAVRNAWINPDGLGEFLPSPKDTKVVVMGYLKSKSDIGEPVHAQRDALVTAGQFASLGATHITMYYCGEKGNDGAIAQAKAEAQLARDAMAQLQAKMDEMLAMLKDKDATIASLIARLPAP